MVAFAATSLADAETRICGPLRQAFPELFDGLSAPTLSALFAIAMDQAEQYDMESERDVYAYFAGMLYWGPGFDKNDELGVRQSILANPEMDGPERARQIRIRILVESGRLL